MTGAHVKWAVSLALAGDGDDGDARRHLERIDPLLRGAAKRRLQNEIEAVLEEHPNTPTGRPLLEAVGKRLRSAPSKNAPRPVWWATPLVGVLIAGGIAMAVLRVANEPEPFDPSRLDQVAESADAYVNGGSPMSLGEPGDKLFGEALPKLVIALDRHARKDEPVTEAGITRAEKNLLTEEHKALIGDEAFTSLTNLAAACRATLIDGEDVTGDVDELNAALAKKGLAYYIDSDTRNRTKATTVMLYAHFVERVRVYEVPGGNTERVLWLRRLDRLNQRTTLIGSTHDGSTAAVIRRNLVDTELMDKLLPMLKEGTAHGLWSLRGREKRAEYKFDVERLAGKKMRDEIIALGVNPKHANKLGALLAERDKLFVLLRTQASANNVRIRIPKSYRFDMEPFMVLRTVVGKQLLRDLEKIDKALAAPDMGAVYSRVRNAYVTAVEHHEVHHRIDDHDTVPAALQPILGTVPEGERPSPFARRLMTELSAYLAEMGNSQLPVTTYVRLMGFVFDSGQWDSTYADTSLAITEALARALDIKYGALVANGSVNRSELAKLFTAILQKSPAELRAAAKKAYKETFGHDLAEPELKTPPAR